MASETDTIIAKLDPEQMKFIRKNYLDTIDRVIQERQIIRWKMELTLNNLTEAYEIFSKLHPESVIVDKPSFSDLYSEVGIISGNLFGAIELVKQVFDSIQVEVRDET